MNNADLYNKIYNELNFEEAMNLYREENESYDEVNLLLSEWSNIILYEKHELSLKENMNIEYGNISKNEIKKKIKNLKKAYVDNEYFYSEKNIEKNNKKSFVIPYIIEYGAITFDCVVRNNKFLFNINLPYKKINDVLHNIISFAKTNRKILTQYDQENSFLFHSMFIEKLNETIDDNIKQIFNNGVCAKFIQNIILESGMEHYIDINMDNLIEKNDNKKEEIIRCLIIMGLPINIIWPNKMLMGDKNE